MILVVKLLHEVKQWIQMVDGRRMILEILSLERFTVPKVVINPKEIIGKKLLQMGELDHMMFLCHVPPNKI